MTHHTNAHGAVLAGLSWLVFAGAAQAEEAPKAAEVTKVKDIVYHDAPDHDKVKHRLARYVDWLDAHGVVGKDVRARSQAFIGWLAK